MLKPKWRNEQVIMRVKDLAGLHSWGTIAEYMNKTFPDYTFTAEGIRKWHSRNIEPFLARPELPDSLYQYPRVEKTLEQYYKETKDIKAFGVISDLQVPYHNVDLIEQAVRQAVDEGCELMVLAGDIFQADKFGYFNDTEVPFKDEYSMVVDLISRIKEHMRVLLVSGNHDRRMEKYLQKLTALQEYEFFFKAGTSDILANVAVDTDAGYCKNWWVQIGPVIISHPDRYSSAAKQIGKNIVNTIDWFLPRVRDTFWDTIIQGHSHMLNKGIHNGIHYFENGCACNRLDYNAGPKQTQPVWVQGYSIIHIEDGQLDFNKSKLVKGRILL